MSEIAVITGGTSGIGKATALCLREAGYTVYELSRREQGVEGLHHIRCDITDEDQVRAAVAEIIGQAGRIDVLINNAGFGISGAVEFTDTAEAQRLLDVNFFGMVRMNKAVIPHMRQAGRGRIVNLSSVAAPCPIPFQAYYSAGKAAVNAYTMALANELRPFGITVCAVQPGDIHTGFTAARVKTMAGDDVYQGRIGRSVQRMEHDEQTGMESVYTLLDIDRGVPEVWGSKYDVREILRACYYAIDKKPISQAPLSFKEREMLKVLLKKVKGTDIELLLKESGLIK